MFFASLYRIYGSTQGVRIDWHPFLYEQKTCDFGVLEKRLRHFGKYLKKIKVHSGCDSRQMLQNIFDAISENCANTLEEFCGYNVCIELEQLRQPFVQLKTLKFSEIFQRMPIENLNEIFPKLRSLEFFNVRNIFDSFQLEQQFNLLEHIGVYNHSNDKFNMQDLAMVRRIAKLNPQLNSFGLHARKIQNYTAQIIFTLFPNIQHLDISNEFAELFHLEHLTSMKMCYINDSNHSIPLSPKLERLKLTGWDVDGKLVNFLHQCLNLTSVKE